MSDAGKPEYVPDHLYERLFQPWKLPELEWPLCKEDWARVDVIARLPWEGYLLDYGCGDGTLGAMVRSRNPLVRALTMYDQDERQIDRAASLWHGWYSDLGTLGPQDLTRVFPSVVDYKSYSGALCCEVLEHMTLEDGHMTLKAIHASMKPGAMLCVTVPWEHGSRAEYPGHITKFSWALLGKMIRDAGFKLDERTTRDINGIWLMAIADA